MNNMERTSVKLATDDQKIEIQYEFAKAIRKIPFSTAQKVLKDKKSIRAFIQKICKDLSIPVRSEQILVAISLIEKYYSEVYQLAVDLSEMIFPEGHPAYMAVHPDLDEDTIMNAIQKFFNKPEDEVNLYTYLDSVAKKIDRDKEQKIQKRPSGLYMFAHRGGDEPDAEHRNKSYKDAVDQKLVFASAKEYLLMTGFHKYTKGYFMDKKGWTRTSSVWVDGGLVDGNWNENGSRLELCNGNVGSRDSNDGPRELFLV